MRLTFSAQKSGSVLVVSLGLIWFNSAYVLGFMSSDLVYLRRFRGPRISRRVIAEPGS